MSPVLGRVTNPDSDSPRGPDGCLSLQVQRDWLNKGVEVRIELPRLLTCAVCDGGGCDACGGSGALTLRDREDRPEELQVSLPRPSSDDVTADKAVVLRIPERGGLSSDPSLPRGLLLLKFVPADASDASVRLLRHGADQLPMLAKRSALAAVALIAIYLFLLWFAGWL